MSKKKADKGSLFSAYQKTRKEWTVSPVTKVVGSKKGYCRRKGKENTKREASRFID